MAYDYFLNKDKGLRGGAMDAPNLTVRTAQAKIAVDARNLLTSKEWRALAERQRLEQESMPTAMTGAQEATMARAAMNAPRVRFTADELLAANQPSVPAPQGMEDFAIKNIPGRGESTVVKGVEVKGGPLLKGQSELLVPEEGYGYIGGPSGYISSTPYGIQRGSSPVLGDTLAVEQQQPIAPKPRSMSPFLPEQSTLTPELVVSELLGSLGTKSKQAPSIAQPTQQMPISAAPTPTGEIAPMTVRAVIPPASPSVDEYQQQAAAPEIQQQMVQPSTLAQPQAYRPQELKVEPFNLKQIMSQPSASETIAMTPALREYQVKTQTQIEAYKANVQAQRNSFNDSINNQVKELNLRKGEADLIKTQLANKYAAGTPPTGTVKVGNKTFGYFGTSPTSSKLIEIDPKLSPYEQNLQVKQQAYSNVSRLISEGKDDKASEAFAALTGRPEDFLVFKQQVELANQTAGSQTKAKPVAQPTQTTAKPAAAKRLINKQTGEVLELKDGKYVPVK